MQKPILFLIPIMIFIMGFWVPENHHIPVQGAQPHDWNPNSFWHGGRNYAHKGIDIFAKKGTPTLATTSGWVLFRGKNSKGGNAVLMLGAKWRLHYYGHLDAIDVGFMDWVKAGTQIGTVGNTGNENRPPALYYSIKSLPPQLAQLDLERPKAWEKVFYVNPHKFLTQHAEHH